MSALTLSANHNFHGEKTLGVRAGYAGYNKSAVAGAEFSYRFNRWLRVAPNANYVFRRSGADALTVNLNVQFPLNFSLDRMAVYPEVGLGFASWNYHGARSAGYDDASTRVSRIGLNLGLGYEIDLTPQLRMGVVGEYLVIRRYHGFNALMSVAYRF
ncbi:MAG: outer membrane beta-barrel protein [Muribaculaceae bacterium]|nr:outer membrane beta-barrel protein [Muribaculaceae bacterium]